jgi:predicted transcriptional regulator
VAERKTRYNELLGISNEIRDPDLYQLLGLARVGFDSAKVDPAYREQMSRLQKIRSPKHKSFIEFLKGELRRARTALTTDKRRKEYDAELLEERREQLTMILDVVLADGVFSTKEEERIKEVAVDVGLLPHETEQVLLEELKTRGAVRERDQPKPAPKATPPPAKRPPSGLGSTKQRSPAPRPSTSPKTGGRVTYTSTTFGSHSDSFFPASSPAERQASPAEIRDLVGRKLKPSGRTPAPPRPPVDEIVTAELVEAPPPQRPPGWAQKAVSAQTTGWGKSAQVRQVGVCTGCLTPVTDQEILTKRAERFSDGRVHCPACANRLVAGLICARCYGRITRADMKAGEAQVEGNRVSHLRCRG